MSFGFDPSIILSASKAAEGNITDTLQSLAQLQAHKTQQQQAQAQLAELAQKQQDEQALSGIYRANADTPDTLASALMRGGFGPQAYAAQDQASQMRSQDAQRAKLLQEVQNAHRKHVGELFYGTKDEADYQARRQELASNPDPMLAVYAHALPEKFDPGVTERLGNLAMSAKDRADLKQKELDRQNRTTNAQIMAGSKPQLVVTDEDGTQYLQDPRKPGAPAKPIRDESGNPLRKPATSGASGGSKEWKDFQAALSTGARGSLAKDLQKSLNSSEALESLLKLPNGRLVNATPQQMREAYTALNSLIAKGGSQAVSQIEHLAPDTLAGRIANLKQYLTSEPQGQNTPELVRNILDTAQRESQLARKQLRRQQLQAIPNFAHLRKADQKRFESMLRAPGVEIDPSTIDENGLEATAATGGALSKEEAEELKQLEAKYGGKK